MLITDLTVLGSIPDYSTRFNQVTQLLITVAHLATKASGVILSEFDMNFRIDALHFNI